MRALLLAIWVGALGGCAAEGGAPAGAPAAEAAAAGPEAAEAAAATVVEAQGAPKEGGHATAKAQAPVEISAQPGADGAAVGVVFRAGASDVSISVWGAEGLAVQGDRQPIAGRAFRAGERLLLQVGYTAPATAATLAVQVSGTFGSRKLSAVRSFTVGSGARGNAGSAGSAGSAGELTTDSKGRAVRVMRPE